MLPLGQADEWIERVLGLPRATTERLILTALVLFTYVALRGLTRRILLRTVDDPAQRFSLHRAITYSVGGVAFLVIIRVWFESITGLATYLGLLSAGLAIALQDPLANLAGWVFILVRTPFKIGDRIEIGPHVGDVVDIRPFRFLILEVGKWVHAEQSTGRVIHIPNGWVFKQALANYEEAFGFIWNELEVVVTFESDWRLAKKTLEGVLAKHADEISPGDVDEIAHKADQYHVRIGKVTPVVWTSVADHGVKLAMRYLCKARDRRRSTSELWEEILEAFQKTGIDFAYPTTRRYDARLEGQKPRET